MSDINLTLDFLKQKRKEIEKVLQEKGILNLAQLCKDDYDGIWDSLREGYGEKKIAPKAPRYFHKEQTVIDSSNMSLRESIKGLSIEKRGKEVDRILECVWQHRQALSYQRPLDEKLFDSYRIKVYEIITNRLGSW
ncbi:MAG: hypothetical protein ABIG20_03375, partial [archaeon]